MSWIKDDFTQYNHSKTAHYTVYPNGKVDINSEIGSTEHRISLHPWGMYKLVKDWLESGHGLTKQEKQELKDLLEK